MNDLDSFCACDTYLVAKRVRKLRVNNLSIAEDDWERATRSRIRHVDTKSNSTHDCHCDNIESGSLDPLAKGRPAVPRMRAMRCHPTVLLAKDAGLLLVVVRASGRGSIRSRRLVTAVEETHCRFDVGGSVCKQ